MRHQSNLGPGIMQRHINKTPTSNIAANDLRIQSHRRHLTQSLQIILMLRQRAPIKIFRNQLPIHIPQLQLDEMNLRKPRRPFNNSKTRRHAGHSRHIIVSAIGNRSIQVVDQEVSTPLLEWNIEIIDDLYVPVTLVQLNMYELRRLLHRKQSRVRFKVMVIKLPYK